MVGSHLLKCWSSTQAGVAMSSGEAEFYGVTKAAGIVLGYKSLLNDLGVQLKTRVWTDSSATIGICSRQGLGKLRHINTRSLWVQQKIRGGALEVWKVKGEVNPADLFTKHLSSEQRIHDLLGLFGCRFSDGRAAAAPALRKTGDEKAVLAAELVYPVTGPVVEHGGWSYPGIKVEGFDELLPEAYLHDERRLPHLHGGDLHALFPQVEAVVDADQDPELFKKDWLEEIAVGKGEIPKDNLV